ncbi:hypothetical protein AK830_g6607 [Neonectria ditissima]|uniref:Uncharacterized protein n=1 Tax=Neonectria ditissima TaxID=78410 RepID=A0A0N8H6U3_9HYPO|nr:hypothetical protein AK830_g6607 [Neonectria ditissima]
MAVLALGQKLQLMPGSFSPEDYIDFYENPFDDLENLQTAWRDRDTLVPWSTNNLSNVDVTDVDWYQYNPPAALRKATHITSQVLLDIIWSSIENVKTQAAEQQRQKREKKEQSKLAEDAAKKLDKGKEPYLPINIPQDKPKPYIDDKTPRHSIISLSGSTSTITATDIPSKPEKRRKFALRKFFQRGHGKGESSSTGSTLEALRKTYESRQVSSRNSTSDATTVSRTGSLGELVECVSCLDGFSVKDVIKVPCHSYCRVCFVRLVSAAVQNEQQWPPKCCLNQIPVQTIVRYIPSNLKKTFQERSSEWDIPVGDRIYCSHQGCNLIIKPQSIDKKKRQGTCDNRHATCTICRDAGHKGRECERDPDMDLTNILAEEEGWKSQRWRTCECTMQQLYDLKAAADTKREQRQFREQTDAEELRQILLQIEEFEREETLKAEMLRQEQERLEEERRQHELEERVRQESMRRRDIEIKFRGLRVTLDELHELQQVLVEVNQEEMGEEIIAEIKTAKEELAKKQEAERSELDSLMMTKLADKEYSLNRDFQIRAAGEHDIEEAYHEKLQDYWKGKRDGEKEIEASMLALRKRMDQRQHTWQKWKTEAMRVHEANLKEDWSLREELIYSTKHRLDAACEEKERELIRRKAAEKKWLEMVILERERLMNETEAQEVEGDADSLFTPDLDNGRNDGAVRSSRPALKEVLPKMSICGEGQSAHPLKIFDVTRKQDRFLYALAPMVRNESSPIQDFTVSTNPDQPATIVQFGANVPLEMARAAALVAPRANGVDLNCGCPQSWACAEKLGAALMGHRELVRDMVVETRQRLQRDGWHVGLERDIESPKGRSVSVKIRIHDDLRKTMDFLDTVIGEPQNRLVDWVTIHPRTKSTPSTTPIRTEALEILIAKYAGTLPILLSGDIFDIKSLPVQPTINTNNDAPHASLATLTLNSSSIVATPYSKPAASPSNTNLSGFMSARGLLANPALFAGHSACPWEAVETFMCNVTRCPLPFKLALHHLQEMCGPGMGADKSSLLSKKERAEMTGLANMCGLIDYLDDMIEEKNGRVGGLRRDL